MLAKELISETIPPLKTSDTGKIAINWMNEFNVSHLPIINNKEFLGLISEEDILDLNDPEQAIGNHKLSLIRPFVFDHQHIYDVVKTASELKLSIIPVIDDKEDYIGIITLESLVGYFAELNSINEPGGILVLTLNVNEYSLSEIAQIVESNNAIILSMYISTHKNSTKMEVSLKINKLDLKHIVATFERFDYKITASYQESDYTASIKDRLDSLMNYLNI